MPLVLKDRVKETTTTTGTGTITLAGAVSGYQSFSVIGNANTTYYTIIDPAANAWEVGLGTYTAAGTTLSRDTVLESSNSGSLVNFGAGTKDVFVTYPAERAVVSGDTAYLSLPAPSTSGNVLTSNGSAWTSSVPTSNSTITINNKTGAYTVVLSDAGKVINCTSGTFTVSLTAAASLGSGFNVYIWNTSTTAADVITIDPNGAETIDGLSVLYLRRGEGMQIVCDGTNWQTGNKKTMRVYTENIDPAQSRPFATGANAVAIGVNAEASAQNTLALGTNAAARTGYAVAIGCGPTGTGGISTGGGSIVLGQAYANGTAAFSAINGFSTASYGAQSLYSIAMGYGTYSAGQYSVAIGSGNGGTGAQALGIASIALGGAYASGTSGFAAAIDSNSSSYGAAGTNSIAMGSLTRAASSYTAAIGYLATANNLGSVALGNELTASANYAFALGFRSLPNQYGKFAYASGYFAAGGDAQAGKLVLRRQTTSTTPALLTTDGSSAGSLYYVTLANNSAIAFTGMVVARQQAALGTSSAAWRIEGLIRRESTAATTTLVNTAITVISNVPGWAIALTADTTNGSLLITVTGTATNIRWVANVDTTEVAYA